MQLLSTPVDSYSANLTQNSQDPEDLWVELENPTTKEVTSCLVNLAQDGNKIVDSHGNTWLHLGALLGFENLVRGFIQKGGTKLDLDIRNQDDETPLMLAARAGRTKIVELLADKADVNAMIRSTNWSVLHEAAFKGNTEVVRLLLQKGAKIIEATWVYKNPIVNDPELGDIPQGPEWAHPRYYDLAYKVQEIGKCRPLIPACVRGNQELVELLIHAGDDPHQVLSDGTNALHYCAYTNPDLCRWFLTSLNVNPDVGAFNAPIHHVRDATLLPLFLEKGANLERTDRRSQSFLYAHCGPQGDPAMVLFALKNGADLNNVPASERAKTSVKDWCVPLQRFINSLSHMDRITWEGRFGYAVYHFRKGISADEVEAVLREFKARGIKITMWANAANIEKWLSVTNQSSSKTLSDLLAFKFLDECVIQ